jgi:hypothetical protein
MRAVSSFLPWQIDDVSIAITGTQELNPQVRGEERCVVCMCAYHGMRVPSLGSLDSHGDR